MKKTSSIALLILAASKVEGIKTDQSTQMHMSQGQNSLLSQLGSSLDINQRGRQRRPRPDDGDQNPANPDGGDNPPVDGGEDPPVDVGEDPPVDGEDPPGILDDYTCRDQGSQTWGNEAFSGGQY